MYEISAKITLIERLFALKSPLDGLIDLRLATKDVVVQIRIWRVQAVDPPESLVPVLVRVGQAPENHRVRRRTVPSFRACRVLHKVHPPLSLGNLLVLVAVPLGYRESRGRAVGASPSQPTLALLRRGRAWA